MRLSILGGFPVQQAREVLAVRVNERSLWNTVFWPGTERRMFRGQVSEARFRLARNTTFSEPLIITGKFKTVPGGTIIEITLRLSWFAYAFVTIWNVFLAAALLMGMVGLLFGKPASSLALLGAALALLVVADAGMLLRFHRSASRAEQVLRETFRE